MFEKLFGKKSPKQPVPAGPEISFGRYSDNNKPPGKVLRWTDADNLYKDKKYGESLDAFFDYLRDDAIQNVSYERNGAEGRFEFLQGSKIVRGRFNQEVLEAEVTLARMPQPSVPVMRRLLEMNFSLYYSRFALDDDRLCMRFDSDRETASPSKLYYGLKELATRADKQDDLLVQDFTILEETDNEHLLPVSDHVKKVKAAFLKKWIQETLDMIAPLDADKYSGGIAYLLLSLIYRIDYLITPEGKLLYELEKIGGIYFKKDERPIPEKNRDMAEEFKKMLAMPDEDIYRSLIWSKHTFSIVAPQNYKTIAESIHASNQNMVWYRDNGHPQIGSKISEYGISYCQYSYSLPSAVTELFHILMQVNYADFFGELGYTETLYDQTKNRINAAAVIDQVKNIQSRWKEKYPGMDFKTQNLRFDSLLNFTLSYTNELEFLNMEPK